MWVPDIRTIVLILFLVNAFLSLMLFTYWRNQKTYPGFSTWALSLLAISCGYLFLVLRGSVPDLLSIVGANCLIILSVIMRIDATRRFIWSKPLPIIWYGILVPFTVFYTFFLLIIDSTLIRTIATMVMVVPLLLVAGILAIRSEESYNRSLRYAFAVTLLIPAALSILRTVFWLVVPGEHIFFSTASIDILYFVIIIITDILSTGFFLMLNMVRFRNDLSASEEQYRRIVETAAEGILTLDDHFRITYTNQRVAEMLGYTLEEMVGKEIRSFMPLGELADHAVRTKRQRDGMPDHFERQLTRKNGSALWVSVSTTPVKDVSGNFSGSLGMYSDITERKRAEAALQERERQFRALSENSQDFIMRYDREHRHIYANPACLRATGMTKEQFIGKTHHDLGFPPDLCALWEPAIDRVFVTGQPYGETFAWTSAEGNVVLDWRLFPEKDDGGSVISVLGVSRDITTMKATEQALRESEENYRMLFSNMQDGFAYCRMIFDSDGYPEDLIYLNVNRAFDQIIGIKNVTGKRFTEVFSGIRQSNPELFEIYGRVSLTGIPESFEINFKPIEKWLRISVYSPAKEYFVAVFEDVTERKRAEETIQHALAEKEVLLREIHHRVKNNLAGILALIELQTSSLSDPVQIAPFKELETRIRSMALVHESLSSAKDLARINVASYTEDLTRHLFQVYGMGAEVQCKIEMGDITLPIETATPCGLVMNEIVTNSLKYAFPKTFSCEESRGEPCTIALTLQREGSDYLLGIADNGIGMPEGIDVTISHTLGLFLIRFIVEHQLRGSLEISNAGGTAYTIRFPEPAVKERYTDEKM
jgi:PAS domain S-box-containing protein